MYIRGKHSGRKIWWCEDNQTGKRHSLNTTDRREAEHLLSEMNQPQRFKGFHQQMARTHLLVSDPEAVKRTWMDVINSNISTKQGNTLSRWERVRKSKSFAPIWNLIVSNTTAEDFMKVLASGQNSANMYLRRLHNYALDMNWLLAPVIAKRAWPKVVHGPKRAITKEEHEKIIARENNPERKAYYELCWYLGASQSDVADLLAEDIDWKELTVSFARMKNHAASCIAIGPKLKIILEQLPKTGHLFPYLCGVRECDRATEFKQRCLGLGIKGVTLHSYRYSWSERGKSCGYPERYAQTALGHGSKAVARAYAKNADVKLPSLEEYEDRLNDKILPIPTDRDTSATASSDNLPVTILNQR